MITQTALYNALTQYVKDNKIDSEEIESVSNSISEAVEKSKSIAAKFESSKDIFEKISQAMEKMAENIDPLIATGIYERVSILKDNIDLFETQIMSKLDNYHINKTHSQGLLNKDRIKVFLVGEFSTGKTTFVRRLLGGVSGHIASPPTTALLVIHRRSSIGSFNVTFNNEIKMQETVDFERFLNSYDLRSLFTSKKNIFTPNEIEKTFDDWSSDKILGFLKEANGFPEAFVKIVWNHQKSAQNKRASFLDFADLFDMPGFAGKESHTEAIKRIINEHKPDVVLYLIDKGVPSGDEFKVLPEFLQSIMHCEPYPLFYWVFQKPKNMSPLDLEELTPTVVDTAAQSDTNANKDIYDKGFVIYDKGFLKSKKKSLEDFVNDINEKPEKRSCFDDKQLSFLKETSILDARGLRDDTEMAQNAASIVLQQFFCRSSRRYCEKAGELLSSESNMEQPGVMKYNSFTYSTENPFIRERIIQKIKESSDSSVEYVMKIFLKELNLDTVNDLDGFPFDLKETLRKMKERDLEIIAQMLAKMRKSIFKADKISLDTITDKFWGEYKKNDSWQELLFTVQAYHWLISHYKGLVAPQYINDIGDGILSNIKSIINRLAETKIPFPLSIKLYEQTTEE